MRPKVSLENKITIFTYAAIILIAIHTLFDLEPFGPYLAMIFLAEFVGGFFAFISSFILLKLFERRSYLSYVLAIVTAAMAALVMLLAFYVLELMGIMLVWFASLITVKIIRLAIASRDIKTLRAEANLSALAIFTLLGSMVLVFEINKAAGPAAASFSLWAVIYFLALIIFTYWEGLLGGIHIFEFLSRRR